jgi:hypothetical protein
MFGWNKVKLKDLFTSRFIDGSHNDSRAFCDRPRAGS